MQAWTNVEAPAKVDLRLNACERRARKRLVAKAWLAGETLRKLGRQYSRPHVTIQRWIHAGLADIQAIEEAERG